MLGFIREFAMEDKERDSLKLSNLSTDWISEHEHYTRPVYSQFNDLQQSSDIAQHAHASVIKSILYLPNSNNGTKIVIEGYQTSCFHRVSPQLFITVVITGCFKKSCPQTKIAPISLNFCQKLMKLCNYIV